MLVSIVITYCYGDDNDIFEDGMDMIVDINSQVKIDLVHYLQHFNTNHALGIATCGSNKNTTDTVAAAACNNNNNCNSDINNHLSRIEKIIFQLQQGQQQKK